MKQEPKTAFAGAVPQPETLDEGMQVAQIATRGHVNMARVKHLSDLAFWPMVGLLVVGVGLTFNPKNVARSSVGLPSFVTEALTYDRDTYFDIGGGASVGPNLRWLADYKPTPESLTEAAWFDLVKAVDADIRSNGADPTNWTNVAALQTRPQITRPAKVFSEYAGRLRDGVIAIPEDVRTSGFVPVIAYVGGQWGLALLTANGCVSAFGPVPPAPRCKPVSEIDWGGPYVARALGDMKPVAAGETVQ